LGLSPIDVRAGQQAVGVVDVGDVAAVHPDLARAEEIVIYGGEGAGGGAGGGGTRRQCAVVWKKVGDSERGAHGVRLSC